MLRAHQPYRGHPLALKRRSQLSAAKRIPVLALLLNPALEQIVSLLGVESAPREQVQIGLDA
jgi:hypothetical protein